MRKVLLAAVGVLGFFAFLPLLDAAFSYTGHGPAMRVTAVALFDAPEVICLLQRWLSLRHSCEAVTGRRPKQNEDGRSLGTVSEKMASSSRKARCGDG